MARSLLSGRGGLASAALFAAALGLVILGHAGPGGVLPGIPGIPGVAPAAGLAVAAAFRFGHASLAAVVLGAFLGHLGAGFAWPAAGVLSAALLIEGVVGERLLSARKVRPDLAGMSQVGLFLVLAGKVGPLVATLPAAAALNALGVDGFGVLWAGWLALWLGHVLGVVIAGPLLLAWTSPRRRPSSARWPEGLALSVLLIAATGVVFLNDPEMAGFFPKLGFLAYPLAFWAAARFGLRGASAAVALVALVASPGTLMGLGPFGAAGPVSGTLWLQAFLAVLALSSLLLARSVESHAAALEEARRMRDEAEAACARAVAAREEEAAAREEAEEAQTEAEFAREKAVRAHLAAEAASESKSLFLASISHDLRQPMGALRLFLKLLRDGMPDDQREKVLVQARSSLDTMVDYFNGLMNVASMDLNLVKADRRSVSLATLFSGVVNDLGPVAEAKGMRLACVPCSLEALSDPVLLGRIVRNLVDNAIQHSGGDRVLLGCRVRGDTLRIEVHDRGPGIPSAEVPFIFDELYQVGNPTRDLSKGQGLGLAIVKRAAAMLDHRLDVRSEPGRGTVFSVDVPLRERRARKLSLVSAEPDETDAAADEPMFVIIVEDDPPVARAMVLMLESAGCKVEWFVDGVSALAALPSLPPPALVMADLRLPGELDGIATVDAIRERIGMVEACLITGDVSELSEDRAHDARILFIPKPVRPELLEEIIETVRAA